jgi:hypothetical protein
MKNIKIENCFFVKCWHSAKCGLIPIDSVKPKNITVEDYVQTYCFLSKTTAKKKKTGVILPNEKYKKIELYCLTSNNDLELPVFEDAGVDAISFKGRYVKASKKTLII